MYSCELAVKTAGLDENILDAVKTMRPLPRFYHKFEAFNNLEELKKNNENLNKNQRVFVVIFDEKIIKNINLALLSEMRETAAFKNAKFILCAENFNFNKKYINYLNYLDDVWQKPLTPELIKFYFSKLQDRVKLEEDLLSYTQNNEMQQQKRLLEMARQDYLTGLATRWYFQDYVDQNKNEKHLTFIYFDLDHFKAVNDIYGHQAGDRALAATAEMMQREFADGFIARLGGDEFVTILSGLRHIDEVEKQVKNFMDKLIEYYREIPAMKNLSISAGIAQTNPDETKSIDQLIHESDRALYCAKNCGRACCCIYNPSMENPDYTENFKRELDMTDDINEINEINEKKN